MYKTLAELPDYVKKLDSTKQKRWMSTFNNTSTKNGEQSAFKAANASIKEALPNLKENAPVGSFEYQRKIIRDALEDATPFAGSEYGPYLMYVFPEKIICEIGDKYYELPYTISMDEKVSFGTPVEVEQYYAPKVIEESGKKKIKESASLASELKESGITVTKKAEEMNLNFDFFSLQEASYDPTSGEVEVVLIEAGTNPAKKRHYPVSTIKEAAPQFKGLKMYLNHPTVREENDRPERDITQWASTIVESWYDNGKAMAKVAVHDSWLRERLADPVAREHIGVSINTGGKISYGKVGGQDMQIVEQIILNRSNGPATVDWVTEAGARGRVSRLLKESTTKEKKSMELSEAKLSDLERENPGLVKELKESIATKVKKDLQESGETEKKDKELKETQAENKRLKEAQAKSTQKTKVEGWLKEAKGLPEATKARVSKDFDVTLYESEEKLKEAFDGRIKEEREYLNTLSNKGKIKLGESTEAKTETTLIESAQADLEKRMGITAEKKEEKK